MFKIRITYPRIKVTYDVLKKYYGGYYQVKMANIRKDIRNCPNKGDLSCTASKSYLCRLIKRKICEVEFNYW